MSFFGMVTLLLTIFFIFKFILQLYLKKVTSSRVSLIVLGCIFSVQLIFIFIEGFSGDILGGKGAIQFGAAILIIISIILWIRKLLRKNQRNIKSNIIIIILVLVSFVYTEFFNGFYTFDHFNEFKKTNESLKKYYYVIPFKLVQVGKYRRGLCGDGEVAVVYHGIHFYPTPIKFRENKMFFCVPSFLETDYWFEFGRPMGEQV